MALKIVRGDNGKVNTDMVSIAGGQTEEKLRACYREGLQRAVANGQRTVAFTLVDVSEAVYPREEGLRIAVDEINSFSQISEMDIFLVTPDKKTPSRINRPYQGLDAYIERNYEGKPVLKQKSEPYIDRPSFLGAMRMPAMAKKCVKSEALYSSDIDEEPIVESATEELIAGCPFDEEHESKLAERMKHLSDTYSEYLMYLISERNMENAEVWKRAIVDRKIFSKIKNDVNYHPNKLTALCLCIGAELNLDETKDLLARAGYALSPCDKTDIIFSFFIENKIYDMIELDIQLEEHGLPCVIS